MHLVIGDPSLASCLSRGFSRGLGGVVELEAGHERDRFEAPDGTVVRRDPLRYDIADGCLEFEFPIEGAHFQPSCTQTLSGENGTRRVVRISEGPGIADYVTHEQDFQYSTFGIHVGQDDRLTFFGYGQQIRIHLIDCREDSTTFGWQVGATARASSERVLVIPRGVAHTFDNLAGVTTRDEPIWYADQNPDWNPDNDLISFSRRGDTAPAPRVNSSRLPVMAHLLLSRMSQKTNEAVRGAYASRYLTRIRGEGQYVMIRPSWNVERADVDDTGYIHRNRFTMTGAKSFTIVPNIDSCTSDVVEVECTGEGGNFARHNLSRRWLTWLTGSADIRVEVVKPDGQRLLIDFNDPAVSVVIPVGSWYRFAGNGRFWMRSELELTTSSTDQSVGYGADIEYASESEPLCSPSHESPAKFLAGAAVNALARMEAASIRFMSDKKCPQ